jgi:hypothetical protein
MSAANYMMRTGHSSCLRCEFETRDDMPFNEQDEVMRKHLEDAHPDWMTDGGKSIKENRRQSLEFGSVARYACINYETFARHEWVKAEDYDRLLSAFRILEQSKAGTK